MAKETWSIFVKDMTKKLNDVSPSFCLAKWNQVTLYLDSGHTHSCHHPSVHPIPLGDLENNPGQIHNTPHKLFLRRQMLEGKRPTECDYCWRIEDLPGNHTSDRVYKSVTPWAAPTFDEVVASGEGREYRPRYVEVSFNSTCNFTCVYCMPSVSSKWAEDISRHGPYAMPDQTAHNSMNEPRMIQKIKIGKSEDNPYTDAFWKVLPDWWPTLDTLRITGGEPLLSKHTWSVMDYVKQNANNKLSFAINTNLGVPDELIDRLIEKINDVSPNVKNFTVYTSLEATGDEAEYIRFGVDYDKFIYNVRRVLTKTYVPITVMTTINALSHSSFRAFVKMFLRLRVQHPGRIYLSFNYLRNPSWLDLQSLPRELRDKFAKDLTDMLNIGPFEPYQINEKFEREQLSRIREYVLQDLPPEEVQVRTRNLIYFLDETDRRRKLDSRTIFPELRAALDTLASSFI